MSDASDKVASIRKEFEDSLKSIDKEVMNKVIDTVIELATKIAKQKMSESDIIKDLITCVLEEDCNELRKCIKEIIKQYLLQK